MMRLSRETLREITGRVLPKGQAKWFQDYLGATVPCDRQGPILTVAAYEALVAKANGLRPATETAQDTNRPKVKLHTEK